MLPQIERILKAIQTNLFEKAKSNLEENTHDVTTFEEFEAIMKGSRGFIRALWCEEPACEADIKNTTKANTRCLPLNAPEEHGVCVRCGKPATHRWIFGQSY